MATLQAALFAFTLSTPQAPLQSSYAGGARDERPCDVIVEDPNLVAVSPVTGDVYVVATTTSDDFPSTNDGVQPLRASAGEADVVVVRLNATLS